MAAFCCHRGEKKINKKVSKTDWRAKLAAVELMARSKISRGERVKNG